MQKVIQAQGVKDSNDIEEIVRDIGTSPLEDESCFPNHDGDIFIDNIDDLSNFIGEIS
jgi:hypothetical protein